MDLYRPTLAEVSLRHVIVAEKSVQAEMGAKTPKPEKKLNLRYVYTDLILYQHHDPTSTNRGALLNRDV